MNSHWLNDNLEHHRKCLLTIARHLGLLQEIVESGGFRTALRSRPHLNLELYDMHGVMELSAGDIAWDVLGAIDEQKSLIQHAVKTLADRGISDDALTEYIARMRDFPVRANPDRRDL